MSKCRYCGSSAGCCLTSHPGCRDAHRSGLARIVDLAARGRRTSRVHPSAHHASPGEVGAGNPTCPMRTFPRCWRPEGIYPMNRTVDHVPTRAETDRLRALREDQLPTANARAQEEPVLSIAGVTTRNQPPRPERVSRPLQRSGITDVAGHTLLLRASEFEQVLLRLRQLWRR